MILGNRDDTFASGLESARSDASAVRGTGTSEIKLWSGQRVESAQDYFNCSRGSNDPRNQVALRPSHPYLDS